MKILFLTEGSGWVSRNIIPMLSKVGEVIEFRLSEKNRENDLGKIKDVLRNSPGGFRICFLFATDEHVSVEILRLFHGFGVRLIAYYANNANEFGYVRNVMRETDFCLVPEKEHIHKYRAIGIPDKKIIHFPMAADPEAYRPFGLPKSCDVSFVGQNYGNRRLVLYRLAKALGKPVDVFGAGWKESVGSDHGNRNLFRDLRKTAWYLWRMLGDADGRKSVYAAGLSLISRKTALPADAKDALRTHAFLPYDELVKTYSRTKVNLGFNTLGKTYLLKKPLHGQHLREFEVTMSGGFFMTEHYDELAEYFEIGKEVETYRSFEELVDKCRFYVANDAAREKVASAGYERSRRCHTWEKRVELLPITK